MTQRKFFGTDGIRGTANRSPMTAEIALKLGMAAGNYFLRGDHRHRVVIAKDTRLSGYMVEPALTAGFISVGMDVILVGPMPTPAVALLTRSLRADMGVMISASHNPFQDNGIKLFGPDGYKLSDEAELAIEAKMSAPVEPLLAEPEKLGRAKRLDDAQGRYIEFAKSTFPKHLRLDGLKIVLDCANGAAYQVGPMILWELGAEVIPLGIKPDGFNINKECGSTHPKHLCETVVKEGAHLGIAVDGDADRLVICDEKGKLLDGDQLMAMIATYWQKTGQLKGNTLVATEMSNMGLEKYLTERNLKLIRTKVGDRYVIEQMRLHGLNLGGEQSGHLIMSDYATTGDGLIAALQILAMMVEERATMSDLGHRFTPYPQILKNIRYGLNNPLEHPNVQKAIAGAKESLAENGRVFIRKSGTEPLIRVMVEAEDQAKMHSIANDLEATILSCLTPHS
jgi:phosphoglucosamine mutase